MIDTAKKLKNKMKFFLSISSVNMTKSAGNYKFGLIHGRNP